MQKNKHVYKSKAFVLPYNQLKSCSYKHVSHTASIKYLLEIGNEAEDVIKTLLPKNQRYPKLSK